MKLLKLNIKKLLQIFNKKYKLYRKSKYNKNEYMKLKPLVFHINKINKWYYKNFLKNKLTNTGEFFESQSLSDFIEKMAVWYEVKYPDEIINCENYSFDYEMTNFKSLYRMYNFEKSLSQKEKWYIKDACYPNSYYVQKCNEFVYITKDGTFKAKDLSSLNSIIKQIDGKNINDVLKIMEQNDSIEDAENIKKIIKKYQLEKELKEKILDCVMFRIIERGQNRIGPRRALLFAKEFNRNTRIPIMYGIDLSDPNLNLFIEEYLKCNEDINFMCYINYFSRSSNYQKINKMILKDIIDFEKSKTYQKKIV